MHYNAWSNQCSCLPLGETCAPRARVLAACPDTGDWPNDLKAALKGLWEKADATYRRLYRAKIQAINGQDQTSSISAVNYIPSDGDAVDYDIEGMDAILRTTELETADVQDFFAHTLPPDDLDVAGDNAASGTPIADAPSGPESHLKPLPDWRGVLFECDGDLCEAVRFGVAAVERLNEAKGTKLIRSAIALRRALPPLWRAASPGQARR